MANLSMNELTTLRWSLEEDAVEFSQAGFDGIGIYRPKLTDLGVEAACEVLRRSNLKCSNLMWAGGFTGSEGNTFRDSVLDAVEAIQLAAQLNADCLVVYSGAWGGHTTTHAHRLVRNALREILPFAEEFGVPLAMEPMHASCGGEWTFLETIADTLELLDEFENPFLRIAVDTYHLGLECLESRNRIRDLANIAHRIAIVHVGDGMEFPDDEQNRCPLGDGILPVRRMIETLLEGGYDGFLDVELIGEGVEQYDYPELLRRSRKYLGELLAPTR